jgi:hypothetical protein
MYHYIAQDGFELETAGLHQHAWLLIQHLICCSFFRSLLLMSVLNCLQISSTVDNSKATTPYIKSCEPISAHFVRINP